MAIKILQKLVAEQIAAGEVIENPSSVVKELVENSLDAGADRIEVSIDSGGKEKISVVDNGTGIVPEEVPLAFQRFATSKLGSITDLDRLSTLGFRGEALPSIAAVARVTMVTRRAEEIAGTRLVIEGSEVKEVESAGSATGTAVTVEDLFFNTPGREKFLRAHSVETGRVTYLVTNFALANPAVAFRLNNGPKNIFHSPGDGNLLHAFAAVHGAEMAGSMIELKRRDPQSGCEVEGYISSPHTHRSSRRWITLIVNGRLVKDAMLLNALERGYSSLLPGRRYPLAVLKITVPPDSIDVNVHPAKTEIRFQRPEDIKELLYRAARATLSGDRMMRSWPGQKIDLSSSPDQSLQQKVLPGENLFSGSGNARDLPEIKHYEAGEGERRSDCRTGSFIDAVHENTIDNQYRLIGQYLQSYLVVQKGENLLLIDQHAAHESVVYHQLLADQERGKRGVQLTLPLVLEMPAAWVTQLEVLLPHLKSAGFDLEPLGENSFTVRAVPYGYRESFSAEAVYDLLDELINSDDQEADRGKHVLKTVACKRAVKAKQLLSREEMQQLLDDFAASPAVRYCPHGRPSVISFERASLEKSFDRKGH